MLLFFDIETAPVVQLNEMPLELRELWKERYCKDMPQSETHSSYFRKRAGLYAEFSKILCISLWYIVGTEIKIKTLMWAELDILKSFFKAIEWNTLAWYNIKRFDMPFICKRAVIRWMDSVPKEINNHWKKPWELECVDVMEIWKFGGWMTASLGVVCEVLDIQSPKGEIQWNNIWEFYFSKEFDIEKVKNYCEADVEATIKIYDKLKKVLL